MQTVFLFFLNKNIQNSFMADQKHFWPFWTLYVTCPSELSVAPRQIRCSQARIDPRLRMSCGSLLKTRHVLRKPAAPPNHQGGESWEAFPLPSALVQTNSEQRVCEKNRSLWNLILLLLHKITVSFNALEQQAVKRNVTDWKHDV